MSQVFFFDYAKNENPLDGTRKLLERTGLANAVAGGRLVAVKLHMGEWGNVRYLRPAFASSVIKYIKDAGGQPFLFDKVASYPGGRETKRGYLETAASNGFSHDSVSAPVVIADDDDTQLVQIIEARIDGCTLDQVKVPQTLLDTACIVVLSHVKGHELAGFGGAVKHLAMGCVSTGTKRAQHLVNRPQLDPGECDGCGICAGECHTDAIEIADKLPIRDDGKCISCGTCLLKCPSDSWVWPTGSKEKMQVYMAHAAMAVTKAYEGKIIYLNFVQDVVPDCDCSAPSGLPVVPDIGILLSQDAVAIDKASLDLIADAPLIGSAVTGKSPDPLGAMHGTNSLVQLDAAEKLGMGTQRYNIVHV